jgi:hypothetical protein
MKSNLISVSQQYLIDILRTAGVIPQNVTASEMQLKLSDGNVYVRREITGTGGIVNLIDSGTLEKIGTSSFNGQKLPAGVKQVLERVRLSFSEIDDSDANKLATPAGQSYTNKYTDVAAKIRAAHFILTKGGKKIVEAPVSQFLSLATCEGMVAEHDCYDLPALRYLEGNEQLEIQLSFPDDVKWPTGKKYFVSAELIGPRAQA